jgi:hypothetical protein
LLVTPQSGALILFAIYPARLSCYQMMDYGEKRFELLQELVDLAGSTFGGKSGYQRKQGDPSKDSAASDFS